MRCCCCCATQTRSKAPSNLCVVAAAQPHTAYSHSRCLRHPSSSLMCSHLVQEPVGCRHRCRCAVATPKNSWIDSFLTRAPHSHASRPLHRSKRGLRRVCVLSHSLTTRFLVLHRLGRHLRPCCRDPARTGRDRNRHCPSHQCHQILHHRILHNSPVSRRAACKIHRTHVWFRIESLGPTLCGLTARLHSFHHVHVAGILSRNNSATFGANSWTLHHETPSVETTGG